MTDNKLIAEFMGVKPKSVLGHGKVYNDYSKSWDWLMPVVQKIAENHTFITPYFNTSCKLDGSVFVFGEYVDRKLIKKLKRKGENISLINAVYKQVVEFIKEYNESNKMDILPTSVQ